MTFVKQNKIDFFQKIISPISHFIHDYAARFNYTWQHKKAYLRVEKELTGKNTLTGYLHDVDKLVLYAIGFPGELAHNIHTSIARHHQHPPGVIKDLQGAVIDWECARITKPDKPLNARATWQKYYPNVKGVEPVLTKLGL